MKSTRKHLLAGIIALGGAVLAAPAHSAPKDPAATAEFINLMVEEHGFDRDAVTKTVNAAVHKESIIDAITRPAEAKPWKDYRKIFITDSRIKGGVEFWREHAELLQQAEAKYGVPPQIITAIIGVETRYGGNTGSYRVMDALATLGFGYPKRGEFFRKQLKEYLLLAREEGVDPFSLKGSYAGAMGLPQFIPSSFRAYAVDFDGDGRKDIWTNPADAIGSVANYFKVHGWKSGAMVASSAGVVGERWPEMLAAKRAFKPVHDMKKLREYGVQTEQLIDDAEKATFMQLKGAKGREHWVGLKNFYVITRYNHSRLYAMAVHQLSEEIARQYQKP